MSVHNLSREPMRRGDAYVGRNPPPRWARLIPPGSDGADGYFGNPYVIGADGDREQVIAKFEEHVREGIETDPEFRDRVRALEGKRLFCWCAPAACHGDVLERIAGELNDPRIAGRGAPPDLAGDGASHHGGAPA